MARPRIARSKEDIAAIPAGQPVQIELPPEGEVIIPPDTKNDGGKVPPPPAPPVVAAPEPERRKDETPDPEIASLKEQLQQLKDASESQRRRADEAIQQANQLRQQFDTRDRDYHSAITGRGQAELDAIENGIMAATTEAEVAEREITAFGEAADWGGMAKSQAKLARAHSRMVDLENAKSSVEYRLQQWRREAEERAKMPPPPADPVEDWISRMQGVNNAQKDWLRQHRELVTDDEKNARLRTAHYDSQKEKIEAGTPAYFQYLEERLGYREKTQDDDEVEVARPQIVSAPPSREAPSASGRSAPTRVTLTAQEREIAASAGIDEITYARNKLKMLQMKAEGHYKE